MGTFHHKLAMVLFTVNTKINVEDERATDVWGRIAILRQDSEIWPCLQLENYAFHIFYRYCLSAAYVGYTVR